MNFPGKPGPLILVVENIEETRDGIEKLLKADGYRIVPARTVEEAVFWAKLQPPDLVLMCPTGPTPEVIRLAHHLREQAALNERIPVVIFCVEEVPEGEEVAIDQNIFLARLDNFNQLRALLCRLLLASQPAFKGLGLFPGPAPTGGHTRS